MKFNISENVKVRLTTHGMRVLKEQYDELKQKLPNIPPFQEPKKDENGYSEFQLWSLMETFGAHCGIFKQSPFETEIILSDKEEVCEWRKIAISDDVFDGTVYKAECGHQMPDYFDDMKFCPFCTRPIHVITEIEMLELDGAKPSFSDYPDNTCEVEYVKWIGKKLVDNFTFYRKSRREAIESWNTFAKRMGA